MLFSLVCRCSLIFKQRNSLSSSVVIEMAWELELTGAVLEDLYVWIDNIPLSKPKKKIERDFSDGNFIRTKLIRNVLLFFKGILTAEVIKYYLPDLVTMKSYLPNSAISQKKINWGLLNKKVFSRLGLNVPDTVIKDLCDGKPGVIEIFLFNLRLKIDEELEARQKNQSQSTSSPRQSLLSLNNLPSTDDGKINLNRRLTNRTTTVTNPRDKWVSRLDYEDLKQNCLQLQEEVEILQARLRRLEHVVQLKELRINELSTVIDDYRRAKPSIFHSGSYRKKTNNENNKQS